MLADGLRQDAKIDLHLHTTLSDGKLTPRELVQLLDRRGVAVAAITDHDSTEGLDEAFSEARRHPNLRLVPGIEISADSPLDDKGDVHVLGYFVDYHNAAFQARLRSFRDERESRGQRMVERLAELGYPVDWDRVLAIAGDAGIGRPHIAQALVERGYIKTQKEAFSGLLEDGGPASVSRPHLRMDEAAGMIREVGGVPVLAHPIFAKEYRRLLTMLADMGFVGFEVHYAEFGDDVRADLARLAEELDMLPCGGSDYHALGTEGEHLPGTAGPPVAVLRELESRAASQR